MTESPIPDFSSVASPPRRDLNYRLVEEGELIGSGGQAVVKQVELPGEQAPQTVAVKEPQQPTKTVDIEVVESFFEEARTWRVLDSREREKPLWADSEHIVGIVDIGEDLPWLAMEYMDGGSLADRLDENSNGLPLDEALWIGECLCNGVKLAHDYGIAHLDLKPANVLFRETGGRTWDVPKIADWGLSRVLIEHSGSMDALSVEYAAPEQFDSSRFGDPDKYTDIYQLGAVVYALLTGDPPYTGNQATIMHDTVYGDLPPNPSEKTNATNDLDNVIGRALNKQKGERYSDVGRFAEELRNIRRKEMEGRDVADLTFPWLNYERTYWKVPCPGCGKQIHNTKQSFTEHWSECDNCDGVPQRQDHPLFEGISDEELQYSDDSTILIWKDRVASSTADSESNTNSTSPNRTAHKKAIEPKEALEGTDLFIRYTSKDRATLETAHTGEIEAWAVNENLEIQYHTQFEADNVAVNTRFTFQPFEAFLTETIHYQFVKWLIRDLLYQVRDTGNEEALQDLYDVLPKIDRAEFNGDVMVNYKESGEQRRSQEAFDVILRNRMGEPLIVANLNDSREGATESMMENLLCSAERVGQSSDAFAGAFLVTQSFFEPLALETVDDAIKGELPGRNKRKSFVNLLRKNGYHLCLVEERNDNFSILVPEL